MIDIVEPVVSSTWTTVLLSLLSLFFVLKISAEFSRGATLLFGTGGGILLYAWRVPVAREVAAGLAQGLLTGRTAMLIGARGEIEVAARGGVFAALGATALEVFLLDETTARAPSDADVLDRAIQFAARSKTDLVLLQVSWADQARIDRLREHLRILPLPVVLLPDRVVRSVAQVGGTGRGEFAVELQRAPLTRGEIVLKRSVDVCCALLGIIGLSPLLLTVALLVRLDSRGPILFRQRRRGFSGREFSIWKFRTMHVLEDGAEIAQARPADARVTRIGRVLRASSIDELPQLANVLLGHMSIVGPRPHAVAHDDAYSRVIANYAWRHHMQPGLTGWAQIHGLRGATTDDSMRRRVEFDLWYIDNWSLWLDFRIIVRTFWTVLQRDNAY